MSEYPYLDTVLRLEPGVAPIDAGAFYASAAISLKRIADSLEMLVELDKHRTFISADETNVS